MTIPTTPVRSAPPRRQALISEPERTESGDRALLEAIIQAELAELTRGVDHAKSLVSSLARGALLDSPAQQASARQATRRIPRWHFPMLNDAERNDAFATALERAVTPGDIVLDIGSGTGLLAMLAVQAGAAHVYTCEADPVLAEIARQVIADNGLSEAITVLNAMSTDLVVGRDLSEPVDLIVTEIVDCGLIGEGLLPTVRHARRQLIKPTGTLIPATAQVRGALLSSPAIRKLNSVTQAGGFDVRRLNSVATAGHYPVRLNTWPHTLLSASQPLIGFDLLTDPLTDGGTNLVLPVTTAGWADGLVAWFEMDLGNGTVLRNSPDNLGSHWMQAFIPFATPVSVEAGEQLPVQLRWTGLQLHAAPTPSNDEKGERS